MLSLSAPAFFFLCAFYVFSPLPPTAFALLSTCLFAEARLLGCVAPPALPISPSLFLTFVRVCETVVRDDERKEGRNHFYKQGRPRPTSRA